MRVRVYILSSATHFPRGTLATLTLFLRHLLISTRRTHPCRAMVGARGENRHCPDTFTSMTLQNLSPEHNRQQRRERLVFRSTAVKLHSVVSAEDEVSTHYTGTNESFGLSQLVGFTPVKATLVDDSLSIMELDTAICRQAKIAQSTAEKDTATLNLMSTLLASFFPPPKSPPPASPPPPPSSPPSDAKWRKFLDYPKQNLMEFPQLPPNAASAPSELPKLSIEAVNCDSAMLVLGDNSQKLSLIHI